MFTKLKTWIVNLLGGVVLQEDEKVYDNKLFCYCFYVPTISDYARQGNCPQDKWCMLNCAVKFTDDYNTVDLHQLSIDLKDKNAVLKDKFKR